MKKLLITILLFVLVGMVFSLWTTSHKPTLEESFAHIENNASALSHEDSIRKFIEWYTEMNEEFLSLSDLEQFKIMGPAKTAELNSRFSNWHIKISDYDRSIIKECIKRSIRSLTIHSIKIMDENGDLPKQLTQEQIDFMVEMGENGTDLVLDTTTYLDYFVRWTVDNYNPPTGK